MAKRNSEKHTGFEGSPTTGNSEKHTGIEGGSSETTKSGESEASKAPSSAPRLSVTMDDQGRIDWGRMRPETRDKLRDAIKSSYTPTAEPGKATRESFPPAMAEVVYDSLSMFLMGLARRGGYTQEQAGVLAFSREEKGALIPPTLAVLNKYDTSLGKYQEEIVLGVLLTTIVSGKLALLKKSAQVIEMAPRRAEAAESTVFSPSQAESE